MGAKQPPYTHKEGTAAASIIVGCGHLQSKENYKVGSTLKKSVSHCQYFIFAYFCCVSLLYFWRGVGGGEEVECEINDPLPESHPKCQECRKIPVAATLGSGKQNFYQVIWGCRECSASSKSSHMSRSSQTDTQTDKQMSIIDLLLGYSICYYAAFRYIYCHVV